MTTDSLLRGALTACYVISITVALFANSFVIAIVLRVAEMRTSSNFMFVHMAVADLLIAFTIMPRMIVLLQVGDFWIEEAFGNFLCKLVFYTCHMSIAASILALSFVACDRFCAIIWTIRHSTFFTRKKTIAVLIWFSSAVLMFPVAVVYKNDKFQIKGKLTWICFADWSPLGRHSNQVFYTYILVFVYIIPLSLIAVMYFLICRKLWFRQVPGHAIDRNQRVAQANKRNVVRMLITIVVVFALCWLPTHVLHILLTYDSEKLSNNLVSYIRDISFWLSQANSAINPCLLISLNTRFRRIFKDMILRKSRLRSTRRRKSDFFQLVNRPSTKRRATTGPTEHIHGELTTLTADHKRKTSWSLKSLVHKN